MTGAFKRGISRIGGSVLVFMLVLYATTAAYSAVQTDTDLNNFVKDNPINILNIILPVGALIGVVLMAYNKIVVKIETWTESTKHLVDRVDALVLEVKELQEKKVSKEVCEQQTKAVAEAIKDLKEAVSGVKAGFNGVCCHH